jgi:hypothetical protein
MNRTRQYHKRLGKAIQRRHCTAQERLARDRRQAQHAAQTLEQALEDLGLTENVVAEIEGRLRSQQQLLGKIIGVMFPPLFGCRTNAELCRVRGWDKNLPSRLLGALPKRSWIKRLRRLGLEALVPLWRYAANKSAATRSRWHRYSKSMGGSWDSWVPGGVGRNTGYSPVLMGSSWWSSLARARWSSRWILPSVAPIRRDLALLVVTNPVG